MDTTLEIVVDQSVWDKLKYTMKLSGKKEVSGFFVSSKDDPLHIEDFALLKQECTDTETSIEEASLQEHIFNMHKVGINPNRCMRMWVHTHPFCDNIPIPSGTDDKTFSKMMAQLPEWGAMIVLGGNMDAYVEIKCKTSISDEAYLTIEGELIIKYDELPQATKWKKEFDKLVTFKTPKIKDGSRHRQHYSQYYGYDRRANIGNTPDTFLSDIQKENTDDPMRGQELFEDNDLIVDLRTQKGRNLWEEWVGSQTTLPYYYWKLLKEKGLTLAEILFGEKVFLLYEKVIVANIEKIPTDKLIVFSVERLDDSEGSKNKKKNTNVGRKTNGGKGKKDDKKTSKKTSKKISKKGDKTGKTGKK